MKKLLSSQWMRPSLMITGLFTVFCLFSIQVNLEGDISFEIKESDGTYDFQRLTAMAQKMGITLKIDELNQDNQLHISIQQAGCMSEFTTESGFEKIDIQLKKGTCSVNFNVFKHPEPSAV
ncbi:hypothetical protein [Jiulongibacter sediminis]|uniref:Uncharacterized protein n=1 Tax=Jiulongibacter sediminis TaxID=1605367 RepID=A0A0P7CB87_9BACT|nr:hypothetical protein [Jiulongibacter sediminis]KPM50040.1 hypothetical protein AFM12_05710 [Jiulongibacter sediminis]TBX27067.1 hypothetical protein TK44_05715 [Jiulongibacter sediminis]